MESKKVSIIIPVFNVENFINKCLESVQCQTYNNIEVFLIDDGSTDASGAICDSFAAKNDNWSVLHQNNQGLSAARNSGIKLATGDYLFFLDSDDFIHPQTIQLLMRVAKHTNSEIIEADYFECDQDDNFFKNSYTDDINIKTWNRSQALTNILLNRGCSAMACNKLIRSNLFDGISFPIGKTHEDEFTIPFLVEQVTSYTRLYLPLYAYVQHNSSIMHQVFSEKKLDAIEAMRLRYEYFTSKYPGQFDELVGYTLGSLSNKFLVLYSAELSIHTKQKLYQTARFAFNHITNPDKLPAKQKLSFYFQKVMPSLFWKIVLHFENKHNS